MKKYKGILIRLFTLLLVICLPLLTMAQINPGCNPADPTCVPIDGGLSILIAAGVVYGIKKVRDNRNQQETL